MNVDLEGVRCNEEAARLLPWYVAGRLSPADVERLSSHLQRCAICRQDLDHENAIRELMQADATIEYAPQAGLAKTLSRIDELAREPHAASTAPSVPASKPRWRIGALQWLTGAVLAQAAALGWIGISMHHPTSAISPATGYRTLSADEPSAAGPGIRLVFAASMTLAEFKALMLANGLTVIHGPTEAGVYTVSLLGPQSAAPSVAAVLAALRSDSRVLFAEPVINDPLRKP